MSSFSSILEPLPEHWLSSDRIYSIRSQIFPVFSLLQDSPLLDDLIKVWINAEIRSECINQMSMEGDLTDSDTNLFWARNLWSHRLESLYLRKKSSLDLITYLLLRVKSQNLAVELYHRIKANEDSFENLCLQYATGRERYKGGRIERQSLSDFPESMQSSLLNLQEGELHQPVRLGSDYAVIQILEHISACFDDTTKDRLLMWELNDWISGMTQAVRGHLESMG